MSTGPKSVELFRRACELMPAGVNSPVRAFGSVGGQPLFFDRASGCTFHDADGRKYTDYVNSWGPLILGHAHPSVVEAVKTAAGRGMSFGAPCAHEVELAELVVDTVPFLEMVRFVSSGTEAVMSAVRLARGVTGRDAIVKFTGCYHGHADYLLVAAGSGLATFGTPSSAGVPSSSTSHTLLLPLDDEDAFRRLMNDHGADIAAVIIEGIPANNGLLPQSQSFVDTLREECTRHGAMLIFDEVITGFRLGPDGAAGHYGVVPDLVTYGKVIGGGMPVGAYGGKREHMEQLAPLGPVYQAGTLSGNPVAMAAGAATLRELLADDGKAWTRLDALGKRLATGIRRVFSDNDLPWSVVRRGSILWLALQEGGAPITAECIAPDAAGRYARLHAALIERGVYLAPSAYEVMFVSTAHDETVIDDTVEAFDSAVAEIKREL
ncbi:MAG: glutamate-1-semialdehyde 2,1-aminomutase [Candidatus Sulfomarinibacteraceae bacterium]